MRQITATKTKANTNPPIQQPTTSLSSSSSSSSSTRHPLLKLAVHNQTFNKQSVVPANPRKSALASTAASSVTIINVAASQWRPSQSKHSGDSEELENPRKSGG